MKIYGVTGGAGTGKSEVMRMLSEVYGGYVIISDDVARSLTVKGGECFREIVEYFGQDILGADGEIDRKILAAKVFGNKQALEMLNQMTHPAAKKKIKEMVKQAEVCGKYPFAAVESAILFESGLNQMCDECWYVYTKPEIRRLRMKETRGYSDEKVDAVMKNQLSDEVLFEKCQFIIENNTDFEAVRHQLDQKLECL